MNTLAPIAIITDSAACIPDHLLKKYKIEIVPFTVIMGQETFKSGIDLHPDAFFKRLRAEPELAISTGVPSLETFTKAYEKVATWAKAIISVHVASKMSGACNAAEIAGRESDIPVVVVDSNTSGMAQGFMALEAAREALAGVSLEKVVEKARSMIPNVNLMALLESVAYAVKGGRMRSTARVVSNFFRIQPLIRVQHNKLSLIGQARLRSKGIKALQEKVVEEVSEDPTHLAVHYAEDEEEGQSLLETLKTRINCVESYLTRVPIELGVHSGPGTIGVSYYVERKSLDLKEQLSRLTEYAKEAIRSHMP